MKLSRLLSVHLRLVLLLGVLVGLVAGSSTASTTMVRAEASTSGVFPGQTWQTRTPAEVGLDENKIDQFVQNVGGDGVLIKDGYLVRSWGSSTSKFDWASAAKPVISTLLFFAIQEGKISGPADEVRHHGWNLKTKDTTMTFAHLTNMVSGYSLGESPGQAWAYNDYGTSLLAKTLFDRVFQSTAESAARRTDRLGPLQFEDGTLFSSRGGYGVYTSPRDFARIGWFWLNRGYWNGSQLLAQSYFDNYRKPTVPSSLARTTSVGTDDYLSVGTFGGGNNQQQYGPGIYGYHWWFNAPVPGLGNLTWPDAPLDTYQANGHWNKEVMTIIPSLNMVVAARGNWGSFAPGDSTSMMNVNLKLLKESAADSVATATPTRTPTQTPPTVTTPTPTPQGTSTGPVAGQVVVDTQNPRWLRYHGGGPFFMCGPGDPEDFLYRGTRQTNGTRNGDQLQLIGKLKGTGANSIYLQAVRSHGGDGDVTHNPFVNNDPAQGLNTAVLDQWETWFTEMDKNGIMIYFFLYDDSARVWDTGDTVGTAERSFVQSLVTRFKHHKHLIWVVAEEYGERYTAKRVSTIAAAIRAADDRDHPIAVHKNHGLSFTEFADDPNIDQFAIQYNVASAGELHSGMVQAWNNAQGRYNLNMAEAASYGTGATARKKNWATAMGGAYVMVYEMDIASTSSGDLTDCGRLVSFMQATDFDRMAPRDDLRYGGTEYVLAVPGSSYIAHASALAGNIGLRGMIAGTYDFTWLDIPSGSTVKQGSVSVASGDQSWSKPSGIGGEVALYIRLASSSTSPTPTPTLTPTATSTAKGTATPTATPTPTGSATSPTPTATPTPTGSATSPTPTATPTPTGSATGPTVTGFAGVQEGQSVQGTLAIEARVLGSDISQVDFRLEGPKGATWSERVLQYYFMGDTDNVPHGWDTTQYPDGDYALSATAIDAAGRTSSAQVRFRVAN